jgi:hypothetical protein
MSPASVAVLREQLSGMDPGDAGFAAASAEHC